MCRDNPIHLSNSVPPVNATPDNNLDESINHVRHGNSQAFSAQICSASTLIEPRMARMEQQISALREQFVLETENRKASEREKRIRDDHMLEIIQCLALRSQDVGEGKKKGRNIDAYVAAQTLTVKKILTAEIVRRGAANVCSRFLVSKMKKWNLSKHAAQKCLRILLFAPHVNARGTESKTEVGKLFHVMKHFLLGNYVANCCAFAQRREDQDKNESRGENSTGSADSQLFDGSSNGYIGTRFIAPFWTRANSISKQMIKSVSDSFNETKAEKGARIANSQYSSTTPSDRVSLSKGDAIGSSEEPPTRGRKRRRSSDSNGESMEQKVGVAVLQSIWMVIGKTMNQARQRGRLLFTNEMGFIVEPKANSKWTFRCPSSYYSNFYMISDAKTVDKLTMEATCDMENEAALEHIARQFPKLEMEVEYDVEIFESEYELGERWRSGESRRITVLVNFFDLASKYLAEFFHFRSVWPFVRTSKDGLRFVFAISMALAEVIDTADRMRESGETLGKIAEYIVQSGLLVDGKGTRFKEIERSLLRLTIDQYQKKNYQKVDSSPTVQAELAQQDTVEEEELEYDEDLFEL